MPPVPRGRARMPTAAAGAPGAQPQDQNLEAGSDFTAIARRNPAITGLALETLLNLVLGSYDDLFGRFGNPADERANAAARKRLWMNITVQVNR